MLYTKFAQLQNSSRYAIQKILMAYNFFIFKFRHILYKTFFVA